ncbi:MAG TPA: cytochrome c [Phycisphaerae bacterium]|nr:cytochrome c [Phycisphaerales bacterium]HNO79065.1 cytochrome c [Phycisphaerae bacterium]
MNSWKSWNVCLLAVVLLSGCTTEPQESDVDTSRPTEFGYQTTPRTVRLQEGKAAYEFYCIGCHGENGLGDGPAARMLNPAPRNFQKAKFKFISTRFAELPTDEDLFRTISTGLRGSSMPSWGHLPAQTRWALVEYIKTFSDIWKRPPTPSIPFVTDPYVEMKDKSEAIKRGEVAYHGFFSCWNCHPAYVSEEKISEYSQELGGPPRSGLRDNLNQSAIKKDEEDKTIFAPDFLRDYVKAGTSVDILYRSIAAGITGTAMPTWIDAAASGPEDEEGNKLVTQADIWAIAYYVQDLIKKREVMISPDDIVVRTNREMRIGESGMEYTAELPVVATEEFIEDE